MNNKTTVQSKLFDKIGPGDDAVYIFNRNSKYLGELRDEVERMWSIYRPFCPDEHFETEFRKDFFARLWEMHLACALVENGFSLIKPPGCGPDVLVKEPRVWIEAVTATSGKGNNRVPKPIEGVAMSFPQDKIILRLTAALSEKQKKVKKYIERGIVANDEPIIVAINSAGISSSDIEQTLEVPMIVKGVFGVGDLYFKVPIMGSSGEPSSGYHLQPSRKNANGSEVPMNNFLSRHYECISAVIFCPLSVHHSRRPYGRNFYVVHNPFAAAPLPLGAFPVGREYWAEKDEDGNLYLQPFKDWLSK